MRRMDSADLIDSKLTFRIRLLSLESGRSEFEKAIARDRDKETVGFDDFHIARIHCSCVVDLAPLHAIKSRFNAQGGFDRGGL